MHSLQFLDLVLDDTLFQTATAATAPLLRLLLGLSLAGRRSPLNLAIGAVEALFHFLLFDLSLPRRVWQLMSRGCGPRTGRPCRWRAFKLFLMKRLASALVKGER